MYSTRGAMGFDWGQLINTGIDVGRDILHQVTGPVPYQPSTGTVTQPGTAQKVDLTTVAIIAISAIFLIKALR